MRPAIFFHLQDPSKTLHHKHCLLILLSRINGDAPRYKSYFDGVLEVRGLVVFWFFEVAHLWASENAGNLKADRFF